MTIDIFHLARNLAQRLREQWGGTGRFEAAADTRAQPDEPTDVEPNIAMSQPAEFSDRMDIGRLQVGTVYAKALLGGENGGAGTDEVLDQLGELLTEVFPKVPQFAKPWRHRACPWARNSPCWTAS